MTQPTPRAVTQVDQIADAFVARTAELNPLLATSVGINGYDDQMTDLSPRGYEAQAAAGRDVLAALEQATPVDDVDRVTIAAMQERIGLELELHESAETLGSLNNIASPLQELRMIFDLMPTATAEDWENIGSRLNLVPDAITGYIESLREAAHRGRVAPIRQVREGIKQAKELADVLPHLHLGCGGGPGS